MGLDATTLDATTLAGFAGDAILVVAYFANQHGSLLSSDWRFPFANLLGAGLVLVSLWTQWNPPAALIEFFWAAISLYGLARRLPRRA